MTMRWGLGSLPMADSPFSFVAPASAAPRALPLAASMRSRTTEHARTATPAIAAHANMYVYPCEPPAESLLTNVGS